MTTSPKFTSNEKATSCPTLSFLRLANLSNIWGTFTTYTSHSLDLALCGVEGTTK